MLRIFLLLNIVFIAVFSTGCAYYLFDVNYYKAKKIAKNYSGIYIFDKKIYNEITQDLSKNESERLKMQHILEQKIKNNDQQWLDSKARYENIALSLSGYKNPKNARRLFILDSINKAYPQKLKSGLKYYDLLSARLDSIDVKIPQIIESKIDSMIENDKNFKLKRVIYPQYFYINESGEITLISALIVYLYTNINRVYELKVPQFSNIEFANGEFKHLYKDNIFYAE